MLPAAEAHAAACPAGTPYSDAVMGTTGLAGYWRLDDSTALTACDALDANPGTYSSGVTVGQAGALAGDSDKAARFNGSSTGKVSVPSTTSLSTADTFSIEAWVKRGTTGSTQVIATKQGSAWTLLLNASNRLVLQSNTTNVSTSTAAVADTTTWHHVVATKSGTAVKLYIDGSDVTGTVTNRTLANNTLAVLFGGGASSSFFNGTLDDVALYRTVLSPAQVTNHFLLGRAACPVSSGSYATAVAQTASLIGYWRLDDRSGTTACDSSGRYPGSYAGTFTLAQAGAIAGDSNAAVRFGGASASVAVPALPALNVGDTVSVEAWVKRESTGGTANQVIAAKQDQSWMLMFNPGNRLVLRQANVGDIAASTSTVTDTTGWHHVAATKTGAAVRLYIDGSDVTGTVTNRTLANNTQPLAIGQSGATAYFKGTIDEVAVYRSVLTASQISNHWGLAQPTPAAPSAPAATAASSSRIDLSWTDNSSNETGFVVERSTDSSFTSPHATNLPAGTTTWSDTGLTARTPYWYRVKAVNGIVSSAFTSTATATTKQPPPAPPSGLEATSISGDRINLAWKDNSSNETGFVVERSTDSSFTSPQTTELPADATKLSDTSVDSGTDYWYRAKATSEDSDSEFAGTASKLTTAAASRPPACTPPSTDRPLNRPDRPLEHGLFCIGGRELWSRRGVDAVCTGVPYTYGELYPNQRWCGGRGAEAIAQARAIAYLRGKGGTAPRDTQWEVEVALDDGRLGLADITSQTGSALSVFEAKRLQNWRNPARQVKGYVDALNRADVSPDAEAGSATAELGQWRDFFAVPDYAQTCVFDDGREVWRYRGFVSWWAGYGVLAVYDDLLPCFDPERERPRVPVPAPVDPATVPDPGEDIPKPPEPEPGAAPAPDDPPFRPAPGSSIPGPPAVSSGPSKPVTTPNPGPSGRGGDSSSSTGRASGDPHLATLDGLGYDFQAAGEFVLAEAHEFGLEVQARLTPLASASIVDRVAFNLNGYTVEVSGTASNLLIDGEPTGLPSGKMFDLGDGAFLVHTPSGYTAVWPGAGERPELRVDSWRNVSLYVPPGSDARGLLGNGDGISSNDLVTATGTALPATASAAVIHGTFADSWRIADDESLFTYEAGQSTETFTDRSFPPSILKVQDFDDATLADATAQCAGAGVVDGRQFEDCVIDWAVTRDQTFLDSAATRVEPVTEGGARKIGADGAVHEDFEAGIAPNFSAPRYGSGAGTGTFAGPFSRDGRYVAYVPELPAHLDATVTLDVITLGSWTFLDDDPVTVTINGEIAWTGNIAAGTPSATGTTPSGQPYAVYPVAVTVPHTAEQLNVGVSAELPPAAARAFAVDNVDVRLSVVPPQVFDVGLPASVSDGVPAAGAGNLETRASEDVYAFSITSKQTLRVELWNCARTLTWKLVQTGSGATVKTGYGCSGNTVPDLPAGSYQLKVTSPDHAVTYGGTYKLDVYEKPQPQAFDVTPPASISDGVPAAGAGKLESQVSEDHYSFSTTAAESFRIEFWSCSAPVGGFTPSWKLVDTGSGETVETGAGCRATTVPDLPPGSYRLEVTSPNSTGTYKLRLAPREVVPISLPASISDGAPVPGAGKLETPAAEDAYSFSIGTAASVQITFSQCQASLHMRLVDADTGTEVKSVGNICSGTLVDLPAGDYELVVTLWTGAPGTYKLDVYERPPPQLFDVGLPASISDGVPAAGAGNLETRASEDVYAFSTTSTKSFRVELWSCSAAVGALTINWKLVDSGSGSTVKTGVGCTATTVPDLPAGSYRLHVTSAGNAGTYKLRFAPREIVPISLPASISDGVPAAGAGRLESPVAEDVYSFSTSSAKSVQFEFSQCMLSLHMRLVDAETGTEVKSVGNICSGTLVDLPSGDYELTVSAWTAGTGTYELKIYEQPPAQVFDVALPASISDGVPTAGAGKLETQVSEDIYAFSPATAKPFRIEFWNCAAAVGSLTPTWKLVDTGSGSTVKTGAGCTPNTVPDLAAGSYRLKVTSPGKTGTYKLRLAPREVVPLSLPASISDGVPVTGAGRLDNSAAEDVYSFSTASAGSLQLTASQCQVMLQWQLVNADTGAEVRSVSNTCSGTLVSAVPAGNYELVVTPWTGTGTYKLEVFRP
jgi:uncharacterized protein YdeI (BOF family)